MKQHFSQTEMTDFPRPADWYSSKNCAIQYAHLLEQAEKEMPRKKRGAGRDRGDLDGTRSCGRFFTCR